jgi:hypothetical protein
LGLNGLKPIFCSLSGQAFFKKRRNSHMKKFRGGRVYYFNPPKKSSKWTRKNLIRALEISSKEKNHGRR